MLGLYILLFILLSLLFAGAEISFLSANKFALDVFKNKGFGSSRILTALYLKPNQFLASMLVGKTLSIVVLIYLLSDMLLNTLQAFGWNPVFVLFLQISMIAPVILMISEFFPKLVFRTYANLFLQSFAYPIFILSKLLYVPSKILSFVSNRIIRKLFKQTYVSTPSDYSHDDLETYLEGPISISEEDVDTDILKNALHLKQVRVKDCMVPRTEMVYVDVSDPMVEVIKAFSASNLSRIIVVDGDIDDVLGYIHHQQMFKDPTDVRSIFMEIPFVPETLNVYDLMLKMNKQHLSIACVVDEFGGTAGIITLEDILEEIFGEIEDEHDKEDFFEERLSDHEYLFSGRLELSYLEDTYAISLPKGDYHTLSGYLVASLENIPEQGLSLEQDGYKFTAEQVSDTKIETIRVERV
ncbi:MAG: HlyC/CorC family transporter [Saprospiraceae bacterium]|nr:HlyC/CorC family transporter [Saprospiraceae bacterium]